ncbi:hypothetical protein HMPREF9440_01536 [Sutterella parvirubra YIT 11816]|uniref:Uncharacterized protein n=1 Tax=Sutterella parvirubra YIT 11816 TaxID=762967 RepID=H3KFL7_9BURK|nr:hypothetical protein HMPREF9440_01536 [Sutterella parvirubra YIT 11816]
MKDTKSVNQEEGSGGRDVRADGPGLPEPFFARGLNGTRCPPLQAVSRALHDTTTFPVGKGNTACCRPATRGFEKTPSPPGQIRGAPRRGRAPCEDFLFGITPIGQVVGPFTR